MQKLEIYIQTSENQIFDTSKEVEKISNELYESKELNEKKLTNFDYELKSILVRLKKKKKLTSKGWKGS